MEEHRLPGFDPLRVVAALAVVFSHGWLLALGSEATEPFQYLTGEILGTYGVFTFFMLSGYLVADSRLRSPSTLVFAVKRARRLLPAFVASILVTSVLIVPWFSEGGALAHLTSAETWRNVARVLLFLETKLRFDALAFYVSDNAGQATLARYANGVIWTIRIEVLCYVALAGLSLLGGLRPWGIWGLTVALSAFSLEYWAYETPILRNIGFLAPGFLIGVAARLQLQGRDVPGWGVVWALTALMFVMFAVPGWTKIEHLVFPALMVWPMLWLGRQRWGGWLCRSPFGGARADPSYGIYIWGWPVQQLVLAATGPQVPLWLYLAICLPLTWGVGHLSWRFVERPFLTAQRVGTGSSPR